MKIHIAILITIAISSSCVSGKKSSSSNIAAGAPSGPSSNGYSQPIASPYAAAPASPYNNPYGSQQMVMAGSSPTADYYQPSSDSAGYYGGYPSSSSPGYAPRGVAPGGPAAYEPIPQGSSGHHHHHHPIKRGHGWGHPHNELTTILYIALPLIILPLLLLWPYFLLTPHHHHPVVYAAGWKRSTDGKAPTVSSAEEAKNKKTDELSEKILPKLEKAGKDA